MRTGPRITSGSSSRISWDSLANATAHRAQSGWRARPQQLHFADFANTTWAFATACQWMRCFALLARLAEGVSAVHLAGICQYDVGFRNSMPVDAALRGVGEAGGAIPQRVSLHRSSPTVIIPHLEILLGETAGHDLGGGETPCFGEEKVWLSHPFGALPPLHVIPCPRLPSNG